MLIGISGHARVGKDTLGESIKNLLLSLEIGAETLAFAYELKSGIDDLLLRDAGISAFTTDEEEKLIIRPILVAYGCMMRKINPLCWIERLQKDVDNEQVNIVTDIRFENEADWILENGGHLIHLSRTLEDGSLVGPANDEEARNAPLVEAKAHHKIVWGTISDQEVIDHIVRSFITSTFSNQIEKWKATFPSLTK